MIASYSFVCDFTNVDGVSAFSNIVFYYGGSFPYYNFHYSGMICFKSTPIQNVGVKNACLERYPKDLHVGEPGLIAAVC